MDEELSEREEAEVKKRSNFSEQYQHPEVQYIHLDSKTLSTLQLHSAWIGI